MIIGAIWISLYGDSIEEVTDITIVVIQITILALDLIRNICKLILKQRKEKPKQTIETPVVNIPDRIEPC
jgi:hypothetical protein